MERPGPVLAAQGRAEGNVGFLPVLSNALLA